MPDDAGAAGAPGMGGYGSFWGGFAGAAAFGGAEVWVQLRLQSSRRQG